ncbi:MAG: ABC transporter permease subunit [Brevinematales bacterium]|nr:ABC transporter permease subunit [Brevinematales bacterium]
MKSYIIKRLLLILPTLFGITLVCFLIMNAVPGGPIEQAIYKLKQSQLKEGSTTQPQSQIYSEEIEKIKQYYGFDKPLIIRYFDWLSKIIRGDFGYSYIYEKPVLTIIVSRIPISLMFGLTGFLLSYMICIPLGIKKAIENNKPFDHYTSFLIFAGYSIPGFVMAVILIVLFGGGSFLNLFPISGIISDNFEDLSFFGKVLDVIYHMVLPVFCYLIGNFATLTLLMKNSMLEELQKDYIKTALAKGLSFKEAVFKHALRNALIPVATNIGMILTVILSGSVLIETIFTIDGMGLLGYEAIVNRDYPVALGLTFISSLLVLVGRILSDIALVIVDPRIRFR